MHFASLDLRSRAHKIDALNSPFVVVDKGPLTVTRGTTRTPSNRKANVQPPSPVVPIYLDRYKRITGHRHRRL